MSQDTTGNLSASRGPVQISDEVFARRLHALRRVAGLTQQGLADAMSVAGNTMHRSAIAKIEAGDRAVSIGEAVQLAAVLGVELADLVTEHAADTEEERAHRAFMEAQLKVRQLEHQATQLDAEVRTAQFMQGVTLEKLSWARQELAKLQHDGEDDR